MAVWPGGSQQRQQWRGNIGSKIWSGCQLMVQRVEPNDSFPCGSFLSQLCAVGATAVACLDGVGGLTADVLHYCALCSFCCTCSISVFGTLPFCMKLMALQSCIHRLIAQGQMQNKPWVDSRLWKCTYAFCQFIQQYLDGNFTTCSKAWFPSVNLLFACTHPVPTACLASECSHGGVS